MQKKILYIIAGANGSGKSTLASELLPSENLDFLNADEVAKEICPENIESVKIKAGKIVLSRLEKLLNTEKSFAIETTLSGKNHIRTLKWEHPCCQCTQRHKQSIELSGKERWPTSFC